MLLEILLTTDCITEILLPFAGCIKRKDLMVQTVQLNGLAQIFMI